MKPKTLLTTALLLIALRTSAQITTDGTLGRALNLPGPDYKIRAELGQQYGGNLFHSFRDFNLNSHETATFSGPNSVQNILSRVTGGNPSHIDGLLRSTIPSADMYFINPYGIMFGPNARLDVQGSFHASTADYLRLGENGRFEARNPNNSILTVAPIESFGFLDNPHGSIQVNGRGVLNESGTPRALLQVPDGKTLSLIGGDIHLSQGVDELPLEGLVNATQEEIQAAQYRDQRFSQLYAPGGTLNLASIQRAGEIALTKNGINSTVSQSGTIQLQQEAFISTTGESGGNIFILAGQFTMDNSTIYARTLGLQDGGVIDIQADKIKLDNFSRIRGGTDNTGDGTDIQLTAAESIHIRNNSPLNTFANRSINTNQQIGDAGHIRLHAKNIEINRDYSLNGVFSTDTYGTGRGGDLSMIAENRLDIVSAYIQTVTWGNNDQAGEGGNIYLRAKTLNVEQGGWVVTGSAGSRNGGQLVVEAERVYLGGLSGGFNSILRTMSMGQGDTGNIIIRANELLLEDGAFLNADNYGEGDGGNIYIELTGDLIMRGASAADGGATGIFATIESVAQGGNAIDINIRDRHAGEIHIRAQSLRLEAGALIQADSNSFYSSLSSQNAGTITLDIQGDVVLSGVNPYGENRYGFGSMISTRSQGENAGEPGTIQIHATSVAILDGARVETGSASDNASSGGAIQIQTTEHITIQGDASQISLQEPLSSQQSYLSSTNPETYNQSISGIYAHSTSQTANSVDSGHIELTTPHLRLSQGAQISTASQGGGKAGHITLNVGKLELSDRALIRSNSELDNQITFDNPQTRDNQLIGLGTVVKTTDIGDGRALYQINLGNTLVNLMPVTQVADNAALEALPEQINLTANGDIVQVNDAGDGQAARFIYVSYEFASKVWTRIDENNRVVLSRPNMSLNRADYPDASDLSYADGTLIHVEDMGNGKAADFVYVATTFEDGPEEGMFRGQVFPVKYYQLADTTALQTLTDSTNVSTGVLVDVAQAQDGQPARFVFNGADWVRYGEVLEVPYIAAREALEIAKPGHIAHLPSGSTIYTGIKWIDLGNTYRVNTLSERDALNVRDGDLVKVADTGNGRHDAFLYANGQWIQQLRGGDAGGIVINADKIQLTNGSEISTGSISGGGGSITLNVDKMIFLTDSQVSTSVQEGVGNGGDLTINGPQFVIMDNGKIIAQAYEGRGGNIRLGSKQLIKSPCSQISASSQLGVDGNVDIESPAVNLDDFLVVLPGTQLPSEIPDRCRGITDPEQRSTFIVNIEGEGMPTTPKSYME
jgi:filamentous hemagglutinin family protein